MSFFGELYIYLDLLRTKNPYHGNPFAEFRKETKSDSQEQVKNAIDYYFKVSKFYKNKKY